MASIISAGTTSATALNMSADTSGVLQLASNNGTVALTVDTSQNVGVGTTTPVSRLEIRDSISSVRLTVTNTTNSTNGSGVNFLVFNGGTTVGNGTIRSDNSDNLSFFNIGGERMRIDSSGRVTMPSQPVFNVYNNVDQTSAGAGTESKLSFPDVKVNIGSCYSTSTHRFTAPISGKYLLGFSGSTKSNGFGDNYMTVFPKVNGSTGYYRGRAAVGGANNYDSANFTEIFNLSAGDYVELYFYSQVANNLTVVGAGESGFFGYLVS